METANELMDFSEKRGESLLRMFTVSARDHHLRKKYGDQLCVRRTALARLFADEVISELALTGSDFFLAQGTDITLILRLNRPEAFRKAAEQWVPGVKGKHPRMIERQVNGRGQRSLLRYTSDRLVSSFMFGLVWFGLVWFVVQHGQGCKARRNDFHGSKASHHPCVGPPATVGPGRGGTNL